MDEKARKYFNKAESELSDYERMMLDIMSAAEKEDPAVSAEEAPVEEVPVEEAPVEEVPAEEAPVEEAPVEEAPAEEAPVEEAPVEEAPVEEAPVEEAPVEEAPVEEAPVEEAPVEEAPVVEESPAAEDESDDSDVKIAGEEPAEEKRERIPLLVEEKNPELEPVVLNRPAIQFMNSIEREKKITRKVKQHHRRSGVVVLGLCVALILVAFLYNGFVNKSWGFLEKAEPTPEPTPTPEAVVTTTPAPTPVPTPVPTPEHRYVMEKTNLSWVGAQDLCLASGGYLAVINSMDEFNKIIAMAEEKGIECLWIGCRRDVASNTFIWEHGETVDAKVDPNDRRMSLWASGEPSFIDGDGTAEDYLMLWNHDGGWRYWDSQNDLAGKYFAWQGRIAYVCEFDD